ncbi:MAG: glyceraldehyde-3-phosphate dehydrogenase, partial [Deltaproteobacteria bacterium]
MVDTKTAEYFDEWKEREAIAEAMAPLIGKLYRDQEVICTVFDRPLVNQSTIEILRAHRFARQIISREIWVKDTYPILQAMMTMDLAPARVDLAKLALRYQDYDGDINSFVA